MAINERKLSKDELKKREDIIMKMKGNKRDLVKKYGKDAEAVMYGRATNIAKGKTDEIKKIENTRIPKITELIKDALKNPKKADLDKDGKLSDYEEARGKAIEKSIEKDKVNETRDDEVQDMASKLIDALGTSTTLENLIYAMSTDDARLYLSAIMRDYDINEDRKAKEYIKSIEDEDERESERKRMFDNVDEDLDLGHEDNEPGMIKGDLYQIGKASMDLYKVLDQFDGAGEVDFPSWWQSKIFKAKEAIVGAQEYLEFELKEPAIDAIVDDASLEENFLKKIGKAIASTVKPGESSVMKKILDPIRSKLPTAYRGVIQNLLVTKAKDADGKEIEKPKTPEQSTKVYAGIVKKSPKIALELAKLPQANVVTVLDKGGEEISLAAKYKELTGQEVKEAIGQLGTDDDTGFTPNLYTPNEVGDEAVHQRAASGAFEENLNKNKDMKEIKSSIAEKIAKKLKSSEIDFEKVEDANTSGVGDGLAEDLFKKGGKLSNALDALEKAADEAKISGDKAKELFAKFKQEMAVAEQMPGDPERFVGSGGDEIDSDNIDNVTVDRPDKDAEIGFALDEDETNESFSSLAKKLDKQKGVDKEYAGKIAGKIANIKRKGGGSGPTAKQKKRMSEDETNESFASLAKKIDKQKGKTKKDAANIAGYIANIKRKGGGSGPTAAQKKRMAETVLKQLRK